jgi:hypothetical protein
MFVKELKAEYRGHHIAVRNSWGPTMSLKVVNTEAKLYIDGEIADTNSEAFSWTSNAAILRGSIEVEGRAHVVEVYARAWVRTRMKICVNGRKIAGDLR